MRPLVHRGQVLLILVVGVLVGVAVAGVCLELDGASVLGSPRFSDLFAAHPSQLPSRIVIGDVTAPSASHASGTPGASGASGRLAAARPSGQAGSAAARPSPASTPAPTTAIVPGVVYAYPPEEHGHDGSGGEGHSGLDG